jgi:hypothetical protein
MALLLVPAGLIPRIFINNCIDTPECFPDICSKQRVLLRFDSTPTTTLCLCRYRYVIFLLLLLLIDSL